MRLIRQNLTRITLPAGKVDHIAWDDTLPGFGLRLRAGGKRTWIVQYRTGPKQRRVTLGTPETVSPDEARERARRELARVQLGGDPQAERAEARARAAVTFGAVMERYLESAAKRLRPRSLPEVTRYLRTHWKPLHGLPIHRIDRRTIAARLPEIAVESGPVAANRARAHLSAFFGWAMREGYIEANPVIGTNRPAEEQARARVLSDVELAAIWRACRDDDYGRAVKLLMLTGQRRVEIGEMRWSEIDLDGALWRLPRDRTKNGSEHDVPLSEPALAILRGIPRRSIRDPLSGATKERDLIFGETDDRPFSGWSGAKPTLDARMRAVGANVAPWVLHDLRRTVSTGMAELGVQPHVIEAVLNHISGHKSGVAGIYNRATYSAEKRAALNLWAEHVTRIVA